MNDSPRRTPYQATPRPGKRGHGGRKFLIFLIVLAGLLVGADFALAAVAEHQISQQAREKLKVTDDPAVNIHGFPFSTQALSGNYRQITVSAVGVPVGEVLRELELEADLKDVRAPLSDLIEGRTSSITIGTLEGAAKIKQSDLGRAIKLPTLSIEPAALDYVRSGDEQDNVSVEDMEQQQEDSGVHSSTAGIRLAADTRIGGKKVEIVTYAIIRLRGSAVSIEPVRLEFGHDEQTTVVPDQIRAALLPQFETTVDPGRLPFNVKPTGVAVERGALIVQGEAKDVSFADAGAN